MFKKLSKYLIVFIVISFGLNNTCFAQKIQADSLWSVWENIEFDDTTRLDALSSIIKKELLPNQLDTAFLLTKIQYNFAKENKKYKRLVDALNTQGTIYYFKGDYEQAEFYYSKCMQESQQYKLDDYIAKSYNNLGLILAKQGKYNNAIDYYEKSLAIKKKDTLNRRDVLNTLNNIGSLYSNQGDYVKALDYYSQSLRLSEKYNEYDTWSGCLNNIGGIYKTQKEYDKALIYYKKSLAIKKQMNNKRGIAKCYNNIGIIHRYKKEYDLAIDYLTKSLKIRDEVGDYLGRSKSLNNLSNIYNELGQYKKALECDKESLKIQEHAKGGKGVAISLNNMSSSYYGLKKYNKSIDCGLKSLSTAERMNGKEQIVSASLSLYKAYAAVGNYKEALKYYRNYVKHENEIRGEINQKAIINQEYKYEYEKKKAFDDAQHEKQIAIEKESKEKQIFITYTIALGLCLVGVFLLFVFNRLKVTRKQKELIESAHHQLEEKNKEITDSIQYAKRIQSAILPPSKVVKEYLKDSFIFYQPKDIVAGDFYWMESKEGKVLFAAADCTGHGVPGAMVSVICNNGLNRSVREYNITDPGKILDKTREIVIQEFEKSEDEVKDGMDIALCCLDGNLLKYAGAHNPLWIVRSGKNEIEEIKANKEPIGSHIDPKPFVTHDIELSKGDTIYIFSDGYIDQFGGDKGKKLKSVNFKKLLLSVQNEDMSSQFDIIKKHFNDWKGDLEQLDDVCIIGVRV